MAGCLTTKLFFPCKLHACRRFRVANQLPGSPLRLATGSDGAIWLVIGGEGVYRGYTYNPAQPTKPNLPKTCGDVDPLCADGGCNSDLTACLRCAVPAVMGNNGSVSQTCGASVVAATLAFQCMHATLPAWRAMKLAKFCRNEEHAPMMTACKPHHAVSLQDVR